MNSTKNERNVFGGIAPNNSQVKLCSSFVSQLLCVGYVPCSLISASSVVIVKLSGSMTSSSAFVIVVRARHGFLSNLSVLYSLDFFIPIFFLHQLGVCPLVRQKMRKLVASCRPFWLRSGCRAFSSAVTCCSCSSERRFFISCPSEASWTLVCSSSLGKFEET